MKSCLRAIFLAVEKRNILRSHGLTALLFFPNVRQTYKDWYRIGPLWKQGTLHIEVAKGRPRQVPRLPSL